MKSSPKGGKPKGAIGIWKGSRWSDKNLGSYREYGKGKTLGSNREYGEGKSRYKAPFPYKGTGPGG